MNISNEQIEAVALAVLAVNKYPIEKVWDLLPRLREARLLDPSFVTGADPGDLTVLLAKAGYDRGMLTSMLAERLRNLMAAVSAGALDQLPGAAARRDKPAAVEILRQVKGTGPQVAESAWLLLE